MGIMFFLLQVLGRAIEIYSVILVIYALLSWFPGAYQTTIGQFIIKITRPYLSLFDRLNLSIGMIDFSLIVAILALRFSYQGLIILVSWLVRFIY